MGQRPAQAWQGHAPVPFGRHGRRVVVRVCQHVDGGHQFALHMHRQIEDRPAAERRDQLVVGKHRRDVLNRVGNEAPLLAVDDVEPGVVVNGLGARRQGIPLG